MVNEAQEEYDIEQNKLNKLQSQISKNNKNLLLIDLLVKTQARQNEPVEAYYEICLNKIVRKYCYLEFKKVKL